MRCARSPHRLPPRAANPNPNPNWRDPVVVGSRRRCCRCCRCCRCLLLRRRCCCSARRARFRSWPRRLSRCARQPSRPLQLLQLGGARHAIRRPLVVATALGSARPLPLRGLVHVDFKAKGPQGSTYTRCFFKGGRGSPFTGGVYKSVYKADPTKAGLDKVAAKSFERAGWALATATSRSRSSRRPHRDRHRRGSRPYSPFPHTQLSRLLSLLALAWQVSVMPSRCRRLLAATRCPHLSPALHQPSPENLNDFHVLCVWRQQVWQH